MSKTQESFNNFCESLERSYPILQMSENKYAVVLSNRRFEFETMREAEQFQCGVALYALCSEWDKWIAEAKKKGGDEEKRLFTQVPYIFSTIIKSFSPSREIGH
jgi:hypothetical protein